MRKFLLTLSSFFLFLLAFAQKDTVKTAWQKGGTIALIGGQSGTRNSAIGAEKFSLTSLVSANLWAFKKYKKSNWENWADLSYGIINTSSTGIRKMEDKLDLYSRWRHSFTPIFSWGAVGSFRTQFSNGYDRSGRDKKRISGFFAPAYAVVSPGVQYSPFSFLSMHLGPMVRWVIVSNAPYSLTYQGGIKPDGSEERTLASLYGVQPDLKGRFEYGLFYSALFEKEIMKNVMLKIRVDVSSDFVKRSDSLRHPQNADVYFTTYFTMSVNKWLKAVYRFDVLYDDDVRLFGTAKNRPATQLKSVLGLGLAVDF